MTETHIASTEHNDARPAVRIPITIKHEITPPEEIDDLVDAGASVAEEQALYAVGDLPDIYIVRIPDDEDDTPDTFEFNSTRDSGQAQVSLDDELEIMTTTSELAETEFDQLDDVADADEPLPSADGAVEQNHTFYQGYVAVAEDG